MATKIQIKDNRIIFDGHADSLKECQLITTICDSLAENATFRTVRYESGYAEFERIVDSERAMFSGERGGCIDSFFSNDGETLLYSRGRDSASLKIIITETGLSDENDNALITFGEAGTFLGLATSANATVPEYVMGDVLPYHDASTVNYYVIMSIVEEPEEETTLTTVTFDLSTLNLPSGTHKITVKAKAKGYNDSAESNAVSYVVESESTETTYTLSGTWLINETPNIQNIEITQLFESGVVTGYFYEAGADSVTLAPVSHISISMFADGSGYVLRMGESDLFETFYDTSRKYWYSETYDDDNTSATEDEYLESIRTIYFGDSPVVVSQEFYEWFTLNAVQQFNITYELTNCDLVSGDTTISSGGTATFTVNCPKDYYAYGWAVGVTGADGSVADFTLESSHSFTISNPVSDVVVQVDVSESSAMPS